MPTSARAPSPGTGPRRSTRMRGRRPLPDGASSGTATCSAPPAGVGCPTSPPDQPPAPDSEMPHLQPSLVVLDEDELSQPLEVEEPRKQGGKAGEAEQPEEIDEDIEALVELPDWFPDGWIMDVRRGESHSIYRYYTSPVSGYTFSTKNEALNYLFEEVDERVLESQACADDSELHGMHTSLPDGWVIEIRAGGKMMNKMYKFYVHLQTGMRFFSKEDIVRYANDGEIARCDVKGLCDTSSEDNILAQVEFNPDGLPEGWVKETIFRKCKDGIRKDPYYTDPVSSHVFRTLKSVMSYLETGERTKHAYIPRRSVIDVYSFDKCADLPPRRLKAQGKAKQKPMEALALRHKLPDKQTSNHSKGGTSVGSKCRFEPEEKKFKTVKVVGQDLISSETIKRPRGRPRKMLKQTRERSTDSANSSHKDTLHIAVKEELDSGGGDEMQKENKLDYTEIEKHTEAFQQVDNVSRSLSAMSGDKLGPVPDPDLGEQENSKSTEASGSLTCSSIQKIYMRRNSNQRLATEKK